MVAVSIPGGVRVLVGFAFALLCLCVAAYALMGVYTQAQKHRPWSLLVDLPGQFDINAPLYSSRNAPHDRLRAFPTYEACLAAGQELHPMLLRRYQARDIVMQCQQQ